MMLHSFVCGCACMRVSFLPPVAHVSGVGGNWILCWGGVSRLIEHIDVEIVVYFQAQRLPTISFGPAVPLAVSLQNLTHASLSEAASLTWRCCSLPQLEGLFTYYFLPGFTQMKLWSKLCMLGPSDWRWKQSSSASSLLSVNKSQQTSLLETLCHLKLWLLNSVRLLHLET